MIRRDKILGDFLSLGNIFFVYQETFHEVGIMLRYLFSKKILNPAMNNGSETICFIILIKQAPANDRINCIIMTFRFKSSRDPLLSLFYDQNQQ